MLNAIVSLVIRAIFYVKYLLTRVGTIQYNIRVEEQQSRSYRHRAAPGPKPLPVIGSLHLLGSRDSPFQAMTDLSQKYGDIYSIRLGNTDCLVVSNLQLIREVLNQNGKFFGGRPDFVRFHKLFAGDRNNSLALCDWSDLQLRRRNLARRYCGPKHYSQNYGKLSEVINIETAELISTLRAHASGRPIPLKEHIMPACMNVFTHYMCSKRFDANTNQDFNRVVKIFDEIFWEINQGYALDFLPWLSPFYNKHLSKLEKWSQDIRQFILSDIVNEREAELEADAPENDFLDGLLHVLRDDPTLDKNIIIFMLEDFLGGHSSIGNLVMLALAAVIKNPEVGVRVRRELDAVSGGRPVLLEDMDSLPYTMATLLECLRYSSSPIVPHVATENTRISGYGVKRGTLVFINNYKLNTNEQYWSDPTVYDPTRFLEVKKVKTRKSKCEDDSGMESDGDKSNSMPPGKRRDRELYLLKKNMPQFMPFSIGKRTCIGQTLVKTVSFVMFANIMREFTVTAHDIASLKQRPACMSLPPDTFHLKLTPRR